MKQDPTQGIESILQHAPKPAPPEELKQRLTQDSRDALGQYERTQAVSAPSLFGIWIPRLGFALFFTMAAVFITAQSNQHPSLAEAKQTFAKLELERDQLVKDLEDRSKKKERLEYLQELKQQQLEIVQLKQERVTLTALLDEMTELTAANQSLQQELLQFDGMKNLLTRDPIGEAREEARHIKCISNLKNLGLAYHMAKSEDIVATRLQDLTPYLGSSSVIYCPNGEKTEPEGSYLWKLRSPEEGTFSTVLIQCPFHLNIAMLDGSVQSGKMIESGEISLVDDQGNLKIERATP